MIDIMPNLKILNNRIGFMIQSENNGIKLIEDEETKYFENYYNKTLDYIKNLNNIEEEWSILNNKVKNNKNESMKEHTKNS